MSLYRITLSVDSKQPSEKSEQAILRIYRWGPFWGILNLKTHQWRVETRQQIQNTPYLLEKVQLYDIQGSPPVVEDIWEEEVQMRGMATWNGGLLSVCLPAAELKYWCKKENLEIPEFLSSVTESPVSIPSNFKKPIYDNKHGKNKHQKNRHSSVQNSIKKCYIED